MKHRMYSFGKKTFLIVVISLIFTANNINVSRTQNSDGSNITLEQYNSVKDYWNSGGVFSIPSFQNPFSEEAEIAAAISGRPLSIFVHPEETIGTAIKRICPSVTSAYNEILDQKFSEWNKSRIEYFSLKTPEKNISDYKTTKTIEIYVPFCLESSSLSSAEIQPGESLWDIYTRKHLNSGTTVLNWKKFNDIVAKQNNRSTESLDSLKPGEQLKLPTGKVEIPIIAVEDSSLLPNELEKWNEEKGIESNWGVIDSYSPVRKGTLVDSCAPKTVDTALARDRLNFQVISDSLLRNRLILDRKNWRKDSKKLRIALLDTGIINYRHPLMKKYTLQLAPDIRIEEQIAPIDYTKRKHGMSVLSTLLGGAMLTRSNALYGKIEVAPYRVLESSLVQLVDNTTQSVHAVNAEKVAKGFRRAAYINSQIKIIQLSARFTNEIEALRDHIGRDKSLLIVTSAGNNSSKLSHDTYPAFLGGDTTSNLITVAAVDTTNNLLPTSNYHSEKVDIAAIGCNVAVISLSESSEIVETAFASGTSIAAPKVANIAALLELELHNRIFALTPAQIKRRILFSADILPNLWKQVAKGRVLNPAKALNLYSDSLDTEDGSVIYGRTFFTDDNTKTIELCSDVIVSRRDIRSIHRFPDYANFLDIKAPFMIETEDSSNSAVLGDIETHWCKQLSPNIQFQDLTTGNKIEVQKSKFKNIIFALHPFWQG